jgi:hypothetical protein
MISEEQENWPEMEMMGKSPEKSGAIDVRHY